jgi:hypothetical protein
MKKDTTVQKNTKAMAYDVLLGVVAAELTEAAEIIQHLKAYGMIHPITGVVYPQGTHEDFIKKADEWLWRFRGNNT